MSLSRKPVVALNTHYRAGPKDAPSISYVETGYFDSITEVGAIPIILPPVIDLEDIEQLLDPVDALVMIGGPDLDPTADGYMVHSSMRLMAARREQFDRRLIQRAAMRRLPVLGIGAGMQLLNVSQGGTLHYHLPEDCPRALPHIDAIDPYHRHALEVTPESLMERVYGEGEIRVNSFHHMAVDDVAKGFAMTARCPDGVVEAIESTMEDWLAVGVQFHPESPTASALDLRIFGEFLAAVALCPSQIRMVA